MDRVERPAEFGETLAKGLAVLESFDAMHPEMTLTEIARRVAARLSLRKDEGDGRQSTHRARRT